MKKCTCLLLSLIIASCSYFKNAERDVDEAAHYLINKYPTGKELERAEAVDLEYRKKSLRKILIERKVLMQEPFDRIIDTQKATIDKEKLKLELFYSDVFAEKFCKELKKFLEDNPDMRIADFKKVVAMHELLVEKNSEEKTKDLNEKSIEIIHDGLTELFSIPDKASKAEATFNAIKSLTPYVPTVHPAVDTTLTPVHKIEKRKLVFKVADHPLINHNNHGLGYMYLITNQPNALIGAHNTWVLHDVEFEYEYLPTNNEALRLLYAKRNCRAFMKKITHITKSPAVAGDARLYPNNVVGTNYITGSTSILEFPNPNLPVGGNISFGDFSEFYNRPILRYTFDGALAKWAYEKVYTSHLNLEQIAQALKTVTLQDCI